MTQAWQRRMTRQYDKEMTRQRVRDVYYSGSDFYNFGYWTQQTRNQAEASEKLVEELLARIPERSGNILDVACGKGASTRMLLRYYRPEDVTAINISEAQLQRARENAPGCTFLNMDAVELDFPDASFDNILCVEAAFHFDTRERFYREAFRVLRPGGRLVTSDITGRGAMFRPKANRVRDPLTLKSQLAAAGFEDVEVSDVTDRTWLKFRDNLVSWPARARRKGELSFAEYLQASVFAFGWKVGGTLLIDQYVLTSARKPLSA